MFAGAQSCVAHGPVESVPLPEGDVLSSRQVVVAAGHIAGPWERMFQWLCLTFHIISVACQDHVLPQNSSLMHSESIIGDPASLSDARLNPR